MCLFSERRGQTIGRAGFPESNRVEEDGKKTLLQSTAWRCSDMIATPLVRDGPSKGEAHVVSSYAQLDTGPMTETLICGRDKALRVKYEKSILEYRPRTDISHRSSKQEDVFLSTRRGTVGK